MPSSFYHDWQRRSIYMYHFANHRNVFVFLLIILICIKRYIDTYPSLFRDQYHCSLIWTKHLIMFICLVSLSVFISLPHVPTRDMIYMNSVWHCLYLSLLYLEEWWRDNATFRILTGISMRTALCVYLVVVANMFGNRLILNVYILVLGKYCSQNSW